MNISALNPNLTEESESKKSGYLDIIRKVKIYKHDDFPIRFGINVH